jgi:transglutaminase-like putative cysteine protease
MRISVRHNTVYRYERHVKVLIQLLRLTPQDHDGQHVLNWRIEPSADGALRPQRDAFGNVVHIFSADAPVEELTIRVTGQVLTQGSEGVVKGTEERLPDLFYLRDTDLTQADEAIREFARDVGGNAASDPLGTADRLLAAVHREIAFDPGPTNPSTPAAAAFALRRGVGQDLAHVLVAAARHLGIPARYVSGYLCRADGVAEQAAGHAWAELKIPDVGWIGLDPMTGSPVGERCIRVAVGLDYLGAAPVRGSRGGGGTETMEVMLNVSEVTRAANPDWG